MGLWFNISITSTFQTSLPSLNIGWVKSFNLISQCFVIYLQLEYGQLNM